MLRLNVGFNRKKGESNFGSRGASVQLEIELDAEVAAQPARLKRRIRQLFSLAKSAVNEELDRSAQAADAKCGALSQTRGATLRQTRALIAIAERKNIDLRTLLGIRFAVNEPAELTVIQASHLIHELQQEFTNVCPDSGERPLVSADNV